jgi:1-acyl-sn-glycerol-3-phosphate acyltransferase
VLVRRWLRRISMVASYTATWSLLIILSPLLVPIMGTHDLLRRNRGAGLRLLGMLWAFLTAEIIGLMVSGIIWIRHVTAPGRDESSFMDDNQRLQYWWAGLLFRSGRRLFRLRFSIEGDEQATPGPIIVMMRHASIVDTLLPVVLLGRRHGLRLRYVLKNELRFDPCLDVVGNRLPNYFVRRGRDAKVEAEHSGRLAADLGSNDGVVIYPEGTRFTPQRQARAWSRLSDRQPEVAALARAMKHVLPPRTAGPLALLERGLPRGADVVFISHVGLEGTVWLHDLMSGALVGAEVKVKLWRVPGADVPAETESRILWLFEQWKEVDSHIAAVEQSALASG